MTKQHFCAPLRLGQYVESLCVHEGKLLELLTLEPKVRRWCETALVGPYRIAKVPGRRNRGVPVAEDTRVILFETADDAVKFCEYWNGTGPR